MRLFLLFENWFTYDADNRVDVEGGDLVDGKIQVVARTGSVEHEYNLAGEVVIPLSTTRTSMASRSAMSMSTARSTCWAG